MDITDINLRQLIEQETGGRFNRQKKISCPFHAEKTPSLSVKFFPDANKEKFKCYGCGESGDAIDFVMKYRNLDYRQAREYLGLEIELTEKEQQEEKIKSRIEWELENFRKGQELLGIFKYVDTENQIAYFKAKFKAGENKKQLSYYHITEDGKVVAKRGSEELPYNLFNTLEGIRKNKVIIFVEGEKDANTVNSIFKNNNYVATSIKGCKDLDSLIKANPERIYVIGDTGKAGEEYKQEIYKTFNKNCKEFKFINLPGLEKIGDNKDITDWVDAGYGKQDLLLAFYRSLDIKSKFELQQDKKGIYKMVKKQKDGEEIEIKKYLTNFNMMAATKIKIVDEDQEGIKLTVKSTTGAIIEKTGLAQVFDDTKTFKNFLGTMDLAFMGKVDELTELKIWINQYFALEVQEIHTGVKFVDRNGELIFIENQGSICRNGVNENIKSEGESNAHVIEVQPITGQELKELKKHIFRFASPEKSISIIGTVINNLAVLQAKKLKIKLHHLLIVGESGSGKSTILENVIAPILNYPKADVRSIGMITNFALIKILSDGNYTSLFDEFKPSSLDKYKIANISEMLRNLYDRATISRGNKSLKTKEFELNRPVVIAGEESYPNQEKALIERSCIVYLARFERTEQHAKTMKWLIENEDALNRLGRSLIEIILELSTEEYKDIRNAVEKNIKDLSNRPLTTATNICTGIEILNRLLEKHEVKTIKGYEEHVTKNIKTEILEDGEETHSVVEKMLILYNDMIEDNRAIGFENVVKEREEGIFIKTSEMINQINVHVKNVGADLIPLKLKDFRKQVMKAGYLLEQSNKVIRIDNKIVRFDTYDKSRLRNLNVSSMVSPEMEEVTGVDKENTYM